MLQTDRKIRWAIFTALTTISTSAISASNYEIESRLNIVGATGKPTNDVLGFGVTIRKKMEDNWYLSLNLEYSPGFDFEQTPKIVGIRQDQSLADIDAVGEHTMITVMGEKRFDLDSANWQGWRGFWNLGIGINDVDMGDVTGPVEGGGTFDITTKTDTATVIVGNLGLIQQLGEQWSARYSFGFEHHQTHWDVRDRVSGNTGEINDYQIFGTRVGLSYNF